MRKNAKIIQLSGFFGIIFLLFCVVCLIAGFGVFPAIVAKCLWNWAAEALGILPKINLFQGILLWAIVALSIYMSFGANPFLSVKRAAELDDDEMRDLMCRIKDRSKSKKSVNMHILKSDEIKKCEKVINGNSDSVDNKNDKEKL